RHTRSKRDWSSDVCSSDLSSAVVTVAWSPDSAYVASGSDDKTVQVWQAKTGSRIFTYSNHSSTVFTVGWSPNGKRIASGSYDKTDRKSTRLNSSHVSISYA